MFYKDTYNMEVIQEFSGIIGTTRIDDKSIFWATGFILDKLLEEDILFSDELIDELVEALNVCDNNIHPINWSELEQDLYFQIEDTRSLGSPYYGEVFDKADKILAELNGGN